MASKTILYELANQVATMTLNRPEAMKAPLPRAAG